jgi:tetratricopeptide (TPR) repeat protein
MYEADLAMSLGDSEGSAEILADALGQFQDVQDLWGLTVCLNALGVLAQDRGDPAAAVAYFQRIETIMIERQLPAHYRAHTLSNLAMAYRQSGRAAKAFATSLDAIQLAREARRASVAAAAQGEMARYYLDQGDLAQAATLAHVSLTTFWEIGSTWDLTPILELAAMVIASVGNPELAGRLFAAAGGLREAMPYPIGASEQPVLADALAAVRSALGDEQYAQAWESGRSRPLEASIRDALDGLSTPMQA